PSLLLPRHGHHPHRHSFPTRRSSDLGTAAQHGFGNPSAAIGDGVRNSFPVHQVQRLRQTQIAAAFALAGRFARRSTEQIEKAALDRKSTRLNSSHEWISYAVFCLKKK